MWVIPTILQVTISPQGAIDAGAQWRVDSNGIWRDSGDTVTLLVGTYDVQYKPVADWNEPNSLPVQVNDGQTTPLTGTYIQQTGYLQVTLSPQAAIDAGAQWRVDSNGIWRDSGDTVTLLVGTYDVQYKPVADWNEPNSPPVQVNDGQTTPLTGTYIQQTGYLEVTIQPPAAVTAGAQWKVDSDVVWRDSGDTAILPVGSYTVEYSVISDWNEPNSQPVQINDGQTTTTSGIYILQTVASLIINEFMAFNGTIFGTLYMSGGDDRHPDWIEIHNLDLQDTINLEGWYLTDNDARLAKWRFPAGVTINPNGYLIVYASGWGPNFVDPLGYHHTNFELSSDGEYLALVAPDGQTVVHEYRSYQGGFPPQSLDHSYGIKNDDPNQESYFGTPTPEVQNTDAKPGLVADTKFSHDRGFYDASFSVAITTATEGATIRYTLDGTEPTVSNGLTYTGPIDVNTTTSLRAFAFKTDWLPTNVDTQTYIFPTDVANQPEFPPGLPTSWAGYTADYGVDPDVVNTTLPGYSFEEALLSIPSICVTMPVDDLFGAADGIYVYSTSKGDQWERPASIELVYPDGNDGFQINAGTHIHGGASRNHSSTLKHSFRFVFRGVYGPSKLNFPLYPDSEVERFDQLVLRGSSGDSWTYPDSYRDGVVRHIKEQAQYTRDPWMKDSQRAMGHHSAHSIFVHLYLNGLYWGQYNLCERLNSSFQASYYGGDKEEYDAMHDYGELQSGTWDVWDEMFNLAAAGLASDQDAQFIQGNNPDGTRNPDFPIILNVDNLIDYMILHIYARSEDWPCHNFWAARRRGPLSEGFRFFVWDQENHTNTLERFVTGCGAHIEILPDEVSSSLRPGYLYARLRDNLMFRRKYIDQVHKHMFNGGLLTPEKNEERWMKRATEVDKSVVAESARWGDAKRHPPYKREVEFLTEQTWIRTVYWPQIGPIVLERYRGVGLYPDIEAPMFRINDVNQHGGHMLTTDVLTMVNPNGSGTLYYTLDGSDPRLPTSLQTSVTLVAEGGPKRVLIPTVSVNDNWKGGQPFNDSGWNDGTPVTPGKTG
ncbi:MAG: chitobiase/beta-hexosaminidase C-terminal domain-containing protein, partial [Planctomycetota bacterium]